MAYTYILKLANGQYYVGSTHNLNQRLGEHLAGKTFFTHEKQPELVYYEEYTSYEVALKREKQLKGWTRIKKEKLISGEWKKPSLS